MSGRREDEEGISGGRFVQPAANLLLPQTRHYRLQGVNVDWEKSYHFGGNGGQEGVAVAPSALLTVKIGDTVRVTFSVQYMGPAITALVHAAFGNSTWVGFVEDTSKRVEVSQAFPAYATPTLVNFSILIPIAGDPGTGIDFYAKLVSPSGQFADVSTPTYYDILAVTGAVTPTFQNFQVTDYSKV